MDTLKLLIGDNFDYVTTVLTTIVLPALFGLILLGLLVGLAVKYLHRATGVAVDSDWAALAPEIGVPAGWTEEEWSEYCDAIEFGDYMTTDEWAERQAGIEMGDGDSGGGYYWDNWDDLNGDMLLDMDDYRNGGTGA